ncbi:hypothetical protein B0H19DRAFT_594998 [Mycena capillaripes]|nr:hypothetical protein B0H19DRAFT_594998 [Mycena capillaripes]
MLKSLPSNPSVSTCHCEAGLIALRLRDSDGKSRKSDAADQDAPLAIGVAKKCCPFCRILADIGFGSFDYTWDLKIPEAHSRYHPWVPPHWLPQTVMEQLEKQLLAIVCGMLPKDEPVEEDLLEMWTTRVWHQS